nr:MAG TPA: hypothetical protein [Caudoviricetes sp.]
MKIINKHHKIKHTAFAVCLILFKNTFLVKNKKKNGG